MNGASDEEQVIDTQAQMELDPDLPLTNEDFHKKTMDLLRTYFEKKENEQQFRVVSGSAELGKNYSYI